MVLNPASRPFASAGVVVLLVVAGCAGPAANDHGTPSTAVERLPARNAAAAPLLPSDVLALPEFTFERYEQLLGQLRGTPVVVNMWGSWCPPCRDEAPMLAKAHERYGDRVQFLGIDIEDDRAGAIAFMREFGWRFPSIVDPESPSSFRSALGFLGQPNTLFYDASGERVSTWQGPLTASALRKGIEAILPTT
jgi:thiol-disulfide isomerase/thioredoxin